MTPNDSLLSSASMPADASPPGRWRRFIAWTGRLPIEAPQDRRNALMLQTVLAIIGATAFAMAIFSSVTADASGLGESWIALSISAYACACFHLLRRGLFRLSASLTVIGSLLLIGISYQTYGLQAQSGVQMTHLMPLLFAGLLLGRTAVWLTALANAVALAIGAWVDLGHATNAAAASEVLPNLFLSGMNFLVLAVILDRLILSSQRAIQRSEELNATCLELEYEIEEKERAYERLLHTQRMETIGRLSTGVAHDFNNILSVILGLATPLARQGVPVDAILPGIRQAARRGAVVTRRLLSFSRTQAKQVSRFDLVEAIDEMRSLILPMFHEGIEARLDLPAHSLPVEMDRNELELALLNLVGNACDAMPKEGRFTLSVEASDRHALIRMEDTGVGMPPEVLARVFEPFFTTKPKDKGTGIGMAIVHRFIADIGGEVKVDSAPGQGTRICLRLPQAAPGRAAEQVAAADQLCVLLVASDSGISQLLDATLTTRGYRVIATRHADEAISHVLQFTTIDMVVADYDIPDTDGLM
ncbi:MAG TPA: ATP-binding protein, partial [Pseudoxanthomonas sp.]|nr:ATP-binding protein [Pseudoxanthomonas sp.]